MSEWKVSHTYAADECFYQVYRLRNPADVDHSGNREIFKTCKTEREAEGLARELNEGGLRDA